MQCRKLYYLIVLILSTFVVVIAQDRTKPTEGYLLLKRPENGGVLNVRECCVQIDSGRQNIILIGGDKIKICLSVGYHQVFVHSMDPYDPHSSNYSWKSDTMKIKINKYKISALSIEPKSNTKGYCCGWQMFNLALPNQALKLTVASWVRYALLVVGFRFYNSVFSTYNFDIYQFGYQHELVSFCAY
jgi:hypothetical protein